jgi:hypothetical protein
VTRTPNPPQTLADAAAIVREAASDARSREDAARAAASNPQVPDVRRVEALAWALRHQETGRRLLQFATDLASALKTDKRFQMARTVSNTSLRLAKIPATRLALIEAKEVLGQLYDNLANEMREPSDTTIQFDTSPPLQPERHPSSRDYSLATAISNARAGQLGLQITVSCSTRTIPHSA